MLLLLLFCCVKMASRQQLEARSQRNPFFDSACVVCLQMLLLCWGFAGPVKTQLPQLRSYLIKLQDSSSGNGRAATAAAASPAVRMGSSRSKSPLRTAQPASAATAAATAGGGGGSSSGSAAATASAVSGPSPAQVVAACDELLALAAHLETWGVDPGRILLDPLMRPHTDYFSGAVLQVIKNTGREVGGGLKGLLYS